MRKTKQCKHGTFTYHDNDYWIGGNLEATGEYSEEEVQKLLALIPEDAKVVEVGANIGTITVPLAKKAHTVFAFEPEPTNAELLKQNLLDSGVSSKVFEFPAALGDHMGHANLPVLDYSQPKVNGGAVALLSEDASGDGNETIVSVPIYTLDSYTEFGKIDLIKIDVEGHELEVLKGARETIARDRPRLYVENDRPGLSAALIRYIMEMDYLLFWHLPKLNNPDPFGRQDFISINMLCLPKELPYDVALVSDCVRIMSETSDPHLDAMRKTEAEARLARRAPATLRGNEWACVVRLGGVGDNLIASSVFPALKRKWGHLEVICAEPQHVVFENNPFIDKLTVKAQDDPHWENGLEWQKYWLARSREYAFFANLSHSCEVHRALTRAQTSYYWPASTRRKICGQNYLETVADICEVDYADLDPRFYPTATEMAAAEETKRFVGGKYVGIVITGSRLDKIWSPLAMVVGRIVKEMGLPVVLFGAPGKDFEIAKNVQEYLLRANGTDKDVHLALSADPAKPHWPIRRILTQAMLADVIISPDTGPAWAVSKCEMPKIILLSHASPENITKHWTNTTSLHANPSRVACWPCHLLIDEMADCERLSGRKGGTNCACIDDIAPDVVVENVRRLMFADPSPIWLPKAAE